MPDLEIVHLLMEAMEKHKKVVICYLSQIFFVDLFVSY